MSDNCIYESDLQSDTENRAANRIPKPPEAQSPVRLHCRSHCSYEDNSLFYLTSLCHIFLTQEKNEKKKKLHISFALTQLPDKGKFFKKERFILAHSLRGYSPLFWEKHIGGNIRQLVTLH